MKLNKKTEVVKLNELTINGVLYAYNKETKDLYDYDSYLKQELLLLGKLVKQEDGTHRFQKI
jgi:hypothetical protein